jgi:RNA polymerase sigma factor (sigma-70 family)
VNLALSLKSLFTGNSSNEALMLRYVNANDNQALSQLYDNCGDDLYHFIVTLTDPILAKDICQKTWLKVIEKKYLYRDSGKFKAWLFTMGRNILIDEIRKVSRFESHDIDVGCEQELMPLNLKEAFSQQLLALPFEQREAFSLQQEGFGLQEIANITHCGIETIKSRIRYAKNTLRNNLEKYYD